MSGSTLLNRFRFSPDWAFLRPDGTKCESRPGPILSGEKLVDSLKFKEKLFKNTLRRLVGRWRGRDYGLLRQLPRWNGFWLRLSVIGGMVQSISATSRWLQPLLFRSFIMFWLTIRHLMVSRVIAKTGLGAEFKERDV